jgi:DNA-directed RNA polymerase subunit RPC12/RpoP
MTLIHNDDNTTAQTKDAGTIPTIGKGAVVICPKCDSKYCERIKRSGWVKTFLPWLNLKRYRCITCSSRFYKRG